MAADREIGTLVVVVLKARNLQDKHTFYKQDVVAQISLNDNIKRTPVDEKGGQHPVWDAELRFPIYDGTAEKNRTLHVSCYSKEPRSEDLIGQGQVDITETLRTGEFDDWVKFEQNGVYRGEIYLEMTYFANDPRPIQRRPSKLLPNERLTRPTQPYSYVPPPPHSSPKPPAKAAIPAAGHSPRNSAHSDWQSAVRPHLASAAPPPPASAPHLSPPLSAHGSLPSRNGHDGSLPVLYEDASRLPPAAIPAALRPGGRSVSPSSAPRPVSPGTRYPHSVTPHPPPHPPPVPTLPGVHSLSPAVPAFPAYYQPPGGFAHATPPPHQHTGYGPAPRPYSYNYPPAPADVDPEPELPDPFVTSYGIPQVSFPDEPVGRLTPTPAHPHPHPHPHPYPHGSPAPVLPGRPHDLGEGCSRERTPVVHTPVFHSPPTRSRHVKNPSREERDRAVALALEREEEEREKAEEEQEEHDLELARQLDLELNLARQTDGFEEEGRENARQGDMPGRW